MNILNTNRSVLLAVIGLGLVFSAGCEKNKPAPEVVAPGDVQPRSAGSQQSGVIPVGSAQAQPSEKAAAADQETTNKQGEPTMAASDKTSIYAIPIQTISGEEASLSEHKGKVMLVVNVASECGYTPQYKGLQKLWENKKDEGLVVLGFPANDFGAQEPGSDEEIAAFCSNKFGVDFPMYSKIHVKGPEIHPLYAHLTERAGQEVSWNFNKFLVNREGQVVRHFESKVKPQSEELMGAIEKLL